MQARDRSPDVEPAGPTGAPRGDPAIAAGPGHAAALWSAALAAGLIAGLVAGRIGEVTHQFFKPVQVSTVINGREGRNATLETIDAATVQNSMLTFGLLGAVVGLALGAAGGLARRSARAAAVAAVIGLVAGGVAGVGAVAAVLPMALRTEEFREDSLVRPFLVHAGLWVPLGVAGGLAFGFGAGRRRGPLLAAALGGGLGALLGTGAYELIGGLAFPFAHTDRALSHTRTTRLIAHLCVAFGAAAGAALGAGDRHGTNKTAPRPS